MNFSLFYQGCRLTSTLLILIILGIALSLWQQSSLAFHHFGLGFLTSAAWDPVNENFGALNALLGTLVTSMIAMVLVIPWSLLVALCVHLLIPVAWQKPVRVFIDLMAGIPSIIFGMWGMLVLVPIMANYVEPSLGVVLGHLPLIGFLFSGPGIGIGILTAGIILAMMVLPMLSAMLLDLLETVPAQTEEAAFGLGAKPFEVMFKVLMPQIRSGFIGTCMLGLGRALGETMAVTFVIGNSHQLFHSLFAPGTTISSSIANEFTEALGKLYPSSLLALGFILFAITFVVIVLARLLLQRYKAQ
jgi:phosphate transport system permease protein